jgi:hypothetical protein
VALIATGLIEIYLRVGLRQGGSGWAEKAISIHCCDSSPSFRRTLRNEVRMKLVKASGGGLSNLAAITSAFQAGPTRFAANFGSCGKTFIY